MPLLLKLFLLFILAPLLEIFLLLQIKDWIGFWPTIVMVICTGALGAWLSRQQGRRVIHQWRSAMAERRLPEEGVTAGLLLLVGCVLLVTPGVLTDLLGLSLLVPPIRLWAAGKLRERASIKFQAKKEQFVERRRQNQAAKAIEEARPVEGRVVGETDAAED